MTKATKNGEEWGEDSSSPLDADEMHSIAFDDTDVNKDGVSRESIPVKIAKMMARNSWLFLLSSLAIAIILSVIGVVVGEFKIEVENEGWMSRKTNIANRQIQMELITEHQDTLFYDTNGSHWDYLLNNRKSGWSYGFERRLSSSTKMNKDMATTMHSDNRRLDELDCPINDGQYLMGIWKVKKEGDSVLDSDALLEICNAEVNTASMLEANGLCQKCGNECIAPYSLILALRYYLQLYQSITDAFDMSCQELIISYTTPIQSNFTSELVECIDFIRANSDTYLEAKNDTTSCVNLPFITSAVDIGFSEENDQITYSSSIFPIKNSYADLDRLYEVVGQMDKGGSTVRGVYETNDEYFEDTLVDELVQTDMLLATASFFVTMIAIFIHTRSAWLSIVGISQIFFSIPLSYFVYTFIGGIIYFPFLNFIGVFVVAALGADDIFVAVDKWKNARLAAPNATTEEVAAVALPDAAGAMLLTTATTAVAFFATTICPVTPLMCFAAFVGLLIVVDYLMNIVLVFPALCLYDKWLMAGKGNCCVAICRSNVGDNKEGKDNKKSLINNILSSYYEYFHKFRWIVFALSIVALILSAYFSTNMELPSSSDVRLLPSGHQFELHFTWMSMLLSSQLASDADGGAAVDIVWGIRPGDNGDRKNPASLSSLFLDKSFDPSSREAQIYLRDACERFFDNDFVLLPYEGYECPINRFDDWLQEENSSQYPSVEYESYCDGANSLPMSPSLFDSCFIAWSKIVGEMDVLQKNGKIQVLIVKSQSTVYWNEAYSKLKSEQEKFEDWWNTERNVAPTGVNKVFHTATSFWFYDTNRAMLSTAISAAGIAIGFSMFAVFVSSRSLMLTVFSIIAILFVLTATTASLASLGWTLGFLESICFAILIGISCDFVIHFSHAYKHLPGDRSRTERTRFTVMHMGPSILAAAATTFSAAFVMLFCKVTFFTKFATILFMTILYATLASFIYFLILADLFGPSQPTKHVDSLVKKLNCKNRS